MVRRGPAEHEPSQQEITEITHIHQGPLPDPGTLRAYDDMVPGSAATIIQMAQDQSAHRREMERAAQNSDAEARQMQLATEHRRISGAIENVRNGQVLGWLVAISCVAAACWGMVYDKNPWVIALFLSLPVVGLVNAIAGKK